VGVDNRAFMQGIKECRMYNQGILQKIFESLDDGKKGYLVWHEFLEGMKIVCSKSEKDKVELFLKMVDSGDDDGNGCFDFEEIKEICVLTFQDFTSKAKDDEAGGGADNEDENAILKETAVFQARNIFRLLKYETHQEIPIEAFKRAIFTGDEETQKALRQFCCIDNDLE